MPSNLDIETLCALVLAADLGGYGHAAARLGCRPSAISLEMKRLRESVGADLFRKHRRVVLTEMSCAIACTKTMRTLRDPLMS
jgi:DNA-binding transcriptional LysR family regulator